MWSIIFGMFPFVGSFLLHYFWRFTLVHQLIWLNLSSVVIYLDLLQTPFFLDQVNVPSHPNLQTPLFHAAYFGDIAMARKLLEHGAEIDHPDISSVTPFLAACSRGNLRMAKFLHRRGAALSVWAPLFGENNQNEIINSPTQITSNNNIRINNNHLESTNDREQETDKSFALTGLCMAANNPERSLLTAKWLIETEPTLVNKSCGPLQQTPLFSAATKGARAFCELLLSHGADASKGRLFDHSSPLFAAARHGHVQVVDLFLGRPGVSPHSMRHDGNTPLFAALRFDHLKIVDMMLTSGIDPNWQRPTDKMTPLMVAASYGNKPAVSLLLKFGAHPNLTQIDGKTAIEIAQEYGHTAVVTKLIVAGGLDS